jgi:CheY-like chemotaxis protein
MSQGGQPVDAPQAGPPGPDVRTRLTALLVDDAEDAPDMYALYFKYIGVRVLTARDGRHALSITRAERPDIVVLDLAMPGLSGYDVLRILKGDSGTRDIPVLVLSGRHAQESAMSAGADAYREKPCLPDQLFAEILRVLYGAR